MKIQTFNYTNPTSLPTSKKYTMPFRGNFIQKIFHKNNSEKIVTNLKSDMQYYFDLSSSELSLIDNTFRPDEPSRINLLYALARKHKGLKFKFRDGYNDSNFESIVSMIKNIQTPSSGYLRMVAHSDYTFPQLSALFDTMNKNPLSAELARKLMLVAKQSGYKINYPYKTMSELVNSKYLKELNKNFDNYSPYIKLNFNTENMAINLEKEIEQGTYNTGKYLRLERVKDMQNHSFSFSDLPEDIILENYSADNIRLLKNLDEVVSRSGHNVTDKLKKMSIDIYKTTNDDNYNGRVEFINKFLKLNAGSLSTNSANVDAIPILIAKIDEGKEDAAFIKNVINKQLVIENTSDLLAIIDSVNSSNLNSNLNKVRKVLKKYHYLSIDNKIEKIKRNINQTYYEKLKSKLKRFLGINQ